MEEREICRKTFQVSPRAYFTWFIISLCWIALSIVANIVIRIISGASYGDRAISMFKGPYLIGWGCALLGLIGALIFFLLWKSNRTQIDVVLTNKRIKTAVEKKRLFSGTVTYEESIVLDHVISFEMLHQENGGYSLSFATVKKNYESAT